MYTRIIALIALISALPVSAENGTDVPDDRYQPIEIHADTAIRQERQGLTAYQGNVIIQQGSLRLEADTVTISQADTTSPTEITATGMPARFSQQPDPEKPPIHARANIIYYHLDQGKIQLTGDATLEQGDARVSSASIEYLITEQVFSAGSDEHISDDEPRPRVQVIIPAQQRNRQNTEEAQP